MSANDREWREWLGQLSSEVALDRCDAAETPPDTGDAQEIVGALVPLLRDKEYLVRLAAAETLGRYPDTEAVAALRKYVRQETNASARAYGLSSLGLVGDEKDISLFASVASDQSEGIERTHALLGLFELARRIAIRRLTIYMTTGSDEIRASAAGALAQVVTTPQLSEVGDAIRRQLQNEQTINNRGYFENALKSISSPLSGASESERPR